MVSLVRSYDRSSMRVVVSCLLLLAIVLSGLPQNSRSQVQSTSLVGTTFLTSTVLSERTIFYSLPLTVFTVRPGHICRYNTEFSFNGKAGQEISISLTTNVSIGFFVMTQANFSLWFPQLSCNVAAEYSVAGQQGTGSSYSVNVQIPTDGEYRLVFVNYSTAKTAGVNFDLITSGTIVTTLTSLYMATQTSSTVTSTGQISPVGPQETTGTGVLPIVGGVGVLVVVAVTAAFMLTRKKKAPPRARVEASVIETQPGISTGYEELDQLLVGGLPQGHSILILSASWDERDLLLRRIIKSCVSTGRPVFYVSNDISTTQELVQAYSKDFYAFSEHADKIKSEYGNLFKVPGIGNLSEFNISLGIALKDTHVELEASKIMVLDTLSDILLRHKLLTSLRWLSDLIAKRKSERFTILATLNPLGAPKEETQPIIDVFDGVIQIYEKELAEKTRRFIVIKKMRGRRYLETDLMLDRNKLF